MKFTDIWNNWNAFSAAFTAIAAIGTLIYTILLIITLKQSKRSLQGDMYLRLKEAMTNEILVLTASYCYSNRLEIIENNELTPISGFVISNDKLKVNKNSFMKHVLGNLEDLALLNEKKIIDINFIDAGYGYQILQIGNNEEVKKTIRNIRDQYPETYNGINKIYQSIWKRLDKQQKLIYSNSIFK